MRYATNTSKEDIFLQELEQIVLNNLQNEQFGVTTLAKIKGISRSHLHRKLKLLTGVSISRFIREIRLQQAMELLLEEVAPVSETAYRVGFKSTSYFSTCFHNAYGYPPGEVKTRHQINADSTEVPTFSENEDNSIRRLRSIGQRDKRFASKVFFNSGKSFLQKKIRLIGALLLIVLFFSYFEYQPKSASMSPRPRSLAILPLQHLSNIPNQEYLTAGIHDALIGELGTIKGLRVISRTSTLRYPNSQLLVQEIAKELNVEAIIEGSVLVMDDSVRLQLQLIDVFPEERHLWAQEYYQDIGNLLNIQSNAIKDIARIIEIQITDEDESRFSRTKKIDVESYKAYLRGIYHLNVTPEEFQKGLNYLHQAIENDPADPHGYARLAEGYVVLGHGPNPSNTYWQRGKAAVIRAIELDPLLAEAHSTLAAIKIYYERDWDGAERSFIKANNLNQNLALSHFNYAWYHVVFGKMEEALKEHKLAKELDPLTPIYSADLGTLYYWMGQYDKAIVELEKALELKNDFGHTWWSLGNVYLRKGWHEKAIDAHLNAVRINPVWKWALANTYVVSGQHEKALAIVSGLKTAFITPRIAFGLALISVSQGDLDEAFYWLEYETPDIWLPWIRTWPDFEPLRKDKRFTKFLERFNLPPLPDSAT